MPAAIGEKRAVHEAFSRDYARELHDLLEADLACAFVRCGAAAAPLWLHAVTPPRDSEGS